MPYDDDRKWSDQFVPEIKRIVGPLVIEEASLEDDMMHGTDLIVLRAKDVRIACRMRRELFFEKWPDEFTLRAHRETGAETEHSKIMRGWGTWLFYGHADGCLIAHWMLIDLNVLRSIESRLTDDYCGLKDNGDGTWFKWYDVVKIENWLRARGSTIVIAGNMLSLARKIRITIDAAKATPDTIEQIARLLDDAR